MFRKDLAASLKKIFDLPVRFDFTADTGADPKEQETIFCQIDKASVNVKSKRAIAHVEGRIKVFANADKLPYMYFSKKLEAAPIELTRPFFFHEGEENAGLFENIVLRSMSFVYLFDGQYDPETGSITSLTQQVTE